MPKEGQCGWEKNARAIREKQKRHPYLRRVAMYGTNVWCSSADGCLEEIIGFLRWHRTAFTWMSARLCKACFEYRSRVNGQTSTVSNYPLFFDEPTYSISCPCFNTSRKYLLVLIRTIPPDEFSRLTLFAKLFPSFYSYSYERTYYGSHWEPDPQYYSANGNVYVHLSDSNKYYSPVGRNLSRSSTVLWHVA